MSTRNTHTVGDVRARYTLFKVIVCIGILVLMLFLAQLASAQAVDPKCPIYEHAASWIFPWSFKTTGYVLRFEPHLQNAYRCEVEGDKLVYVDFETIQMLKAYKDTKLPKAGDLIRFEVVINHDQNGMSIKEIKDITLKRLLVPKKLEVTNFWPIDWQANVPSQLMPIFNDRITIFPDGTLYLITLQSN